MKALGRSKAALAAFGRMPPSHRRRWIDHVAEAKSPEARARRIDRCVRDLARPPAGPKAASAGYSGTPLLQKLGIKEGHRVALVDAPDPPPGDLAAPPAGVHVERALGAGPYDVIVLFSASKGALAPRFGEAARALQPSGGLWVAWPKRASGVPTDLTEDVVRAIALAAGLVDNKVCAIDEVWSGLRCVYRLADRPRAA